MSKLAKSIADAIYNFKYGIYMSYGELLERLTNDIDNVSIQIFKEDETVKLPKYAHEQDACMDIFAWKIERDEDRHRWIIHTGLHFKLPEDYELEIRPKSRNTKYRVICTNSPSTVDEGYTGEVLVIYTPLDINDTNFPYKEGDGVAQMIVRRREKINIIEVDDIEKLGSSERGNKGFGSTGD